MPPHRKHWLASTLEQPQMLHQLLKEERARERMELHDPGLTKPYSKPGLFIAVRSGGGCRSPFCCTFAVE